MRVFVLSEDHKEIVLRGSTLATILYDIKTKKAAYGVVTVYADDDFRVFPIEQIFLMPKVALNVSDSSNLGEYE